MGKKYFKKESGKTTCTCCRWLQPQWQNQPVLSATSPSTSSEPDFKSTPFNTDTKVSTRESLKFNSRKDSSDCSKPRKLFTIRYLYVISAVIFTSVQFQSYETIRFFLIKSEKDKDRLTLREMLYVTIFVQTLTTIVINPMDVIITRYQITDESKEKLRAIKIIK